MSDIDCKELETVMKLMQKYNINLMELPNGMKIHSTPTIKIPRAPRKAKKPLPSNWLEDKLSPEEQSLLFKSSSAPKIDPSHFVTYPKGS